MCSIFVVSHQQRKLHSVEFSPNYGIQNNGSCEHASPSLALKTAQIILAFLLHCHPIDLFSLIIFVNLVAKNCQADECLEDSNYHPNQFPEATASLYQN